MLIDIIAEYINELVMFVVGLWFTSLGFRTVGKKPGEDACYEPYYSRFSRHLKWIGPAGMCLAVVLALARLFGR